MSDDASPLEALIRLHRGLRQLGPGDPSLRQQILQQLGPLPAHPRIADLGAGTGAAALALAAHFQTKVIAVDLVPEFLEDLEAFAEDAGLLGLIETRCEDIGHLDWPPESLDLLWSEGAAYNLGFERALTSWRPLLAPGGRAVISELSYFSDAPPPELADYWTAGYPGLGTLAENKRRVESAGFQCLAVHRLKSRAWWTQYYNPLQARMATLAPSADDALATAIAETEREMNLFRRHSDHYGYAFYVMSRG